MKVSKKEKQLLDEHVELWQDEGILSKEQAERARQTYQTSRFDWQSLSVLAFVFAAISVAAALFWFFSDDWFWTLVGRAQGLPDGVKALLFALGTLIAFGAAARRHRQRATEGLGTQALYLLGSLLWVGTFFYTCEAFALEDFDQLTVPALVTTLGYVLLALSFGSSLLWRFALVGYYFTLATVLSQVQEVAPLFTFPLYIVVASLLLWGLLAAPRLPEALAPLLRQAALLGVLTGLWLQSVWHLANETDLLFPESTTATLLVWAVLATLAAGLLLWQGLRQQRPAWQNWGATFVFLNVYTRYFEFGWDRLNGVLFFLLLGISFFLIGRRAEKIWSRGQE